MIPAGAVLSIQRIPLARLMVVEMPDPALCFPEKFQIYLDLLRTHPNADVDPLIVAPSQKYVGMYAIYNGKHRYCASIMAGRADMLCVVVEEGENQ